MEISDSEKTEQEETGKKKERVEESVSKVDDLNVLGEVLDVKIKEDQHGRVIAEFEMEGNPVRISFIGLTDEERRDFRLEHISPQVEFWRIGILRINDVDLVGNPNYIPSDINVVFLSNPSALKGVLGFIQQGLFSEEYYDECLEYFYFCAHSTPQEFFNQQILEWKEREIQVTPKAKKCISIPLPVSWEAVLAALHEVGHIVRNEAREANDFIEAESRWLALDKKLKPKDLSIAEITAEQAEQLGIKEEIAAYWQADEFYKVNDERDAQAYGLSKVRQLLKDNKDREAIIQRLKKMNAKFKILREKYWQLPIFRRESERKKAYAQFKGKL